MRFNDKEKEVLARLEKLTKESTEGQFNYGVLVGAMSNLDFDIIIEYIEKQIELVSNNPDSKKRFQIMKQFFDKLESDRLYDFYEKQRSKNGLYDAKKVSQGSKPYYEKFANSKNAPYSEDRVDSLCKLYAHSYERACRLYFKPLAYAITKKRVNSCGECIDRILEYYPEIEFVLQPFISQIRNSIDHVDYYPKPKEELIVFENREKPPIEITIEQLDTLCMLQIASDVCISAADHARNLDTYKTVQHYFKKTEEYCKMLGIDFKKIVIAWVSKGRNILGLHNALEKLIKER